MPKPFRKPRTIAPGLTVNKLSPAFLKLLKERSIVQASDRITYRYNSRFKSVPARVFRFDSASGSLATHLFDAKTGKLVTNDLKRKFDSGHKISRLIKSARKKKPSNKPF